ncbi:MAG: type 2 isopentenyl-diphosphate Delta-isomerase [Chitinophagaceae bacterium]|nr:type 2 isopentenyl-diphosphate Delta-isomerase [Chitinophagaceae bacterium]
MKQEEIKVSDSRKKSHIELALTSQNDGIDNRFYYEPMLAAHPKPEDTMPVKMGNQQLNFPIWISSMTGGTARAGAINKLLANAARKFRLGMGLGSCRIILEDDTYFEDFNLRPVLGDEIPFFANLGIAQVEQLLENHKTQLVKKLLKRLDANGLVIHVNPLQEWLQPEGDRFKTAPIESIKKLLNEIDDPVMVKEVGQGYGPESMTELLKLPLLAVDFAANGGTNFSKIELQRNPNADKSFEALVSIGHPAEEMMKFLNHAVAELGDERKCKMAIISGGIKNFLDGFYFMSKCKLPSVYAHASAFLKYAQISQEALDNYIHSQINGLLLSRSYLRLKNN